MTSPSSRTAAAPSPQPASSSRSRARVILSDLVATVRLVWSASPGLLVVCMCLNAALALVPAATLWVGKLLLDAVGSAVQGAALTPAGAYREMAQLVGIQLALLAAVSVLRTADDTTRELLGDTLRHHSSRRILEKAATLDVVLFENADVYDALRHAYAEVGMRPVAVALQLVSLGQAVIVLASVGTLMGRLDYRIMPLLLLASIPGVVVSGRFGAESYRMLRRQGTEGRAQGYLGSLLTSDALVKEVRFFGVEPYLLDRWHAYYCRFRAQLVRLLAQRSVWSIVAAVVSTALIGIASIPVLRRTAAGALSIGDFSLFVTGISQVQGQFSRMLASISGIYTDLLYMRNLFDFLELRSRDLTAGEQWEGPIESIEFEHVGFRYPFTERDVLSDISFRVDKGHSIALAGPNGAGKTTIVKLVTRLFEPTRGRILLNGMDAARFSPASVQRAISIIFQDYGHYQMTARENVGLSRIDAAGDDVAIEAAGARSGANEVIETFANRYDTMLGRLFPGGRQLSGGQWQKLALGRLHFRPASVAIYDEPTAALDAVAEAATIRQLKDDSMHRITLIVSHRFSTIRLADSILVLHDGTVVEKGCHAELMRNRRLYARLFELQASGYQSDPRDRREPVLTSPIV